MNIGSLLIVASFSLACLKPGQVLPSRMVVMAEPNPDSLLAALEEAVQRVHTVDPMLQHQQVTVCCDILLASQCQLSEFQLLLNCLLVLRTPPVAPPPPGFSCPLPFPFPLPTPAQPPSCILFVQASPQHCRPF